MQTIACIGREHCPNRDAESPVLVAYAVSFSTIFGHNVMKKMILPLITQLNAVDSLGIFVLQGLFVNAQTGSTDA